MSVEERLVDAERRAEQAESRLLALEKLVRSVSFFCPAFFLLRSDQLTFSLSLIFIYIFPTV